MKLKQNFFQLALEQQRITKTKKTEHTKLTGGTAATLPSMKKGCTMSRHPAEALTVLPRGERESTRFGVAKIEINIVTSCCINLCSNQNMSGGHSPDKDKNLPLEVVFH